jgi:hypothetical protein
MVKEVRSPNSLTKDQYHPQRGISPGSRSSPSNARSDGGHLVRSPGKGGGPASVRRDAVPVVGGESAAPLQQALDRGLKGRPSVIVDHDIAAQADIAALADITPVCVTSGFLVG